MNITSPTSIANTIELLDKSLKDLEYYSLANSICKVEYLKSPMALTHSLSYSLNVDNIRGSQILVTENVIDETTKTITSGNKTANVLYVSGNNILIQSTDTFNSNDVLNKGGKVLKAHNNILGQAPSLANFGRADVGTNSNINISKALDYKIVGRILNANNNSRKLKAVISQEAYQDMLTIYKDREKLDEILKKYMLIEIQKGIDIDIINHIKRKATLIDTLNMSNINKQGTIGVPGEALLRILAEAIDDICIKTVIPLDIFVIGSPDSIKHISSYFATTVDSDIASRNIFYRGSIYGWNILSDITGSSLDSYVLVGAINSTILGIYTNVAFEATPDNQGNISLYCMVQYDIQNTPLDADKDGSSQFIKRFNIIP